MVKKISKKIVDYKVSEKSDASGSDSDKVLDFGRDRPLPDNIIYLHERLGRPSVLRGKTYKIKTPQHEHALYITINDMVLNQGTPYERWRPFEIFINSKNMEHFQWITALTRVMSAVFRTGSDSSFIVEELKVISDPKGGYFQPGSGVYMQSLVAEIGYVIETHMKSIGMIQEEQLSDAAKEVLEEKRTQYELLNPSSDGARQGGFPDGAQLCKVCNMSAVVLLDGCMTCLNCGDSKCS